LLDTYNDSIQNLPCAQSTMRITYRRSFGRD